MTIQFNKVFLIFLCVITLLTAIITLSFFQKNNENEIENKHVITNVFDKSITLKQQVIDCFQQTHDLLECNSGVNGISQEIYEKDLTMLVSRGQVYITFVNKELEDIFSAMIRISFHPISHSLGQDPWKCEIVNNQQSHIEKMAISRDLGCKFVNEFIDKI